MRSAFIIASLAVTLLAAPVPTNEVDFLARREAEIDSRFTRYGDGHAIGDRSVDEVEKRQGRNSYRSVDEVEKRQGRNSYRSVDEAEAEVEKRQGRNSYRSVDEAEVEKRQGRNSYRSVDEAEAEVEKRQGRNVYRSVYDGVVEMIETLKARGFNSATNVPARQPM